VSTVVSRYDDRSSSHSLTDATYQSGPNRRMQHVCGGYEALASQRAVIRERSRSIRLDRRRLLQFITASCHHEPATMAILKCR